MASLVSATPINEYTVKATFDTNMPSVNPTDINDALNPVNYVFSGGYRSLSALSVDKIDAKNFDVTTKEMTNGSTYGLTSRLTSNTVNFTGIGVAPIVESVENPSYGVLTITFSEEMENDSALNSVSSYSVDPVGSAPVIHVTDVTRLSGTQVQLGFTGGGSPYTFTATGVMDVAGNYIGQNVLGFQVSLPGVDELLTGDRIFVETDLGAISLTVSSLSKRRIEDLAIQRTKNLGHSAQISLISGALKDSGVNRDEQKLKLFKG